MSAAPAMLASARSNAPSATPRVGERAAEHGRAGGHAVGAEIGPRRLDRYGVDIEADGAGGAQFERGDHQDGRPGAHVQHARAGRGEPLDALQHMARRGMVAGAESKAGVDLNGNVAGRGGGGVPRGAD